jgi:hypothetical protein
VATFDIEVNNKDAIKAYQAFAREAQKATDSVTGAMGTLKAVGAAAVAFFAGRELVQFFGAGVDAAIAQDNAMRQLQTALEHTGEASREALDDFAEFANVMEASTKYGDDLIISQVALAKSFGLTNSQAKDLVKTATDLSAATGISLEAAVQQLGKTYAGVTGKLDEQVPVLKTLTQEQLKNGDAVRLIAERYGGAAQREIETFSGAMIQAKNAFGNFQEALGTIIIENAAVVAAINAFKDGFVALEGFIAANSDAIGRFVTQGVQTFMTAIPVAVDVVGDMIKAVQFLATTVGLAFSTITNIATYFVTSWRETFGRAVEVFLGFAETIARGVADVPVLGAVFDKLGISTEGAADKVAALREGFTSMVDKAVASTADFNDAVVDGIVTANDKFDSFNDSYEKFEDGIVSLTAKAITADGKLAKSAIEVSKARQELARQAQLSAKEMEKLATDAAKLEATLRKSTVSGVENVKAELAQTTAELKKYHDARVIDATKANELLVLARKNASEKIAKIEAEERTKSLEDAKKFAEERRAAIEKFTSSPISFVLTPDKDAEEMIAGGIGLLNAMLDGAKGAGSLIASGAGAFADSFIPGIGGAVGSVVGKLAEGPESTKQFIKEFVAAVPTIVEAIAESIPVVVEALVDSLINEGGIVRIALAFAKALTGEAIFKALGRQLGLEFGSAFNAANIAQTLGNGIRNALTGLFVKIPSLFAEGGKSIGMAIAKGIADYVKAVFNLYTKIIPGFIKEAFAGAIDFFKNFELKLPDWLQDLISAVATLTTTPEWLQPFIDAINTLMSWGIEVGGGGGGAWWQPQNWSAGDVSTGGDSWLPTFGGGGGGGLFGAAGDYTGAGLMQRTEYAPSDTIDDSATLQRIEQLLSQPQQVSTVITIDSTKLADIILNLTRRNQRLS